MASPHSQISQGADSTNLLQSALRTLKTEANGLEALSSALKDGLGTAFIAAVDLLRATRGRVIVTGMGKSGHIGRKIAATLASTGTPAFFIHAGDAGHGDLGMITTQDVVLALSWSGETTELQSLIDYTRRYRITLIALTAGVGSTLGKAADITLALPEAREACPHNLAPTTSSLMQLALGDALAIALLESRGFTAIDFGVFHPAGKLGAALKFARDLMHTGARIPLVPYTGLLCALLFGWLFARRLNTTADQLAETQSTLHARVDAQTRELEEKLENTRRAERAQSALDERHRILEDMHDGLGAKLLVSLNALKDTSVSRETAVTLLRDCLDELRLTVDAYDQDSGDLAAIAVLGLSMLVLTALVIMLAYRIADGGPATRLRNN